MVRTISFIVLLILGGSLYAQDTISNDYKSFFVEVGGKGFFSFNLDFPLGEKLRWGPGVTLLDYSTINKQGEITTFQQPSPGLMIYLLEGSGNNFLELSAGISTSPTPNRNWDDNDSWLSLHGGIGYRYTKPDGLVFRAGIYPFYRLNYMILPLPGISLGKVF